MESSFSGFQEVLTTITIVGLAIRIIQKILVNYGRKRKKNE